MVRQVEKISLTEAKARTTAWAVTFGDIITLLLTFFIMLLVIMNDAEKHIDRIINMLLDETHKELHDQLHSVYVAVERVTKGVKITMASGRLFRSGDAELRSEIYPLMQQIGMIIKMSRIVNVYKDSELQPFIKAVERNVVTLTLVPGVTGSANLTYTAQSGDYSITDNVQVTVLPDNMSIESTGLSTKQSTSSREKTSSITKGSLSLIHPIQDVVLVENGENPIYQLAVMEDIFESDESNIQFSFTNDNPELLNIDIRKRILNIEIRCEGHTDNQPLPKDLKQKYKSNWDLSTARALNIVKLLSQLAGIPEENFSAMGYGEFRPVDTNTTLEGRSNNRRVEIYLDAFLTTETITL